MVLNNGRYGAEMIFRLDAENIEEIKAALTERMAAIGYEVVTARGDVKRQA